MTSNRGLQPYWRLFATYLRPQQRQILLMSLLVIGGIGLQLANPQIVAYFIDSASQNTAVAGTPAYVAGLRKLFGAAVIFVVIALLRQAANIAAVYVGENVAWTATNALRADLALHCLRLDMTFHKQHRPGELIERVDGDVNQLANFFSQFAVQLGSNLLLLVGVLVLLIVTEWRVGAAVTGVLLLAMVALRYLSHYTTPRWQKRRQVEADLFGSLEEWLGGTEIIRTAGATAYVMDKLYRLCRNRWLATRSAFLVSNWVWNVPTFTFALAYSFAHLFGAPLYQDGVLTIGSLYLIIYYVDLIKVPMWGINRQVEDLQRAAASINRIVELWDEQPTLHDGRGVAFPPNPLDVEFDHVSFTYDDDPETVILDDVDFRLKPGTVLGLLGRTGSGKSTLTKLLFRFYDPTEGVVRLGGYDLREATLAKVRQHIGMVTQEVQLFHASVRDNLTMFDDSIADKRILAVLEELGLREWYAALPAGLDTEIAGDSGLSAGEAQLLAFVRVFLADPGLIILDEASSRLDPATEQLIERAIDKLLTNRTAVIVAHRLGTVQRADEIMVLGNGRVLEHGRREALANDVDSHFYQLLQTGMQEALA